MTTRLAAKWILPITAPALRDGIVAIEGSDVVALGPRATFAHDGVEELGDVVLLPGLVNAHTHLELSGLTASTHRPRDLVEWLMELLAGQQDVDAQELEHRVDHAVRRGTQASLDAGVTTVGDISRFSHLTRPLLQAGPLRTVSYGEVMGIGRHRRLVNERLRRAGDAQLDSEFLIAAVSPHAPYSIEAEGIKTVVDHARNHGMRTCIHLAESVEEIQFLQTGQGRFREMLESLGMWDDAVPIPKLTPVRWAAQLGALGPECLVAHGNYIDEAEIEMLCASGTSVAYCPRTHTYFGHQPHPLVDLLGGGVNVCIGTDSLASSPSLSVLEELAHVYRLHPELRPEVILTLGTLNGARALGVAQSVGSIEPGKRADLAVFQCDPLPHAQPEKALLATGTRLVRLYINGQLVRDKPSGQSADK